MGNASTLPSGPKTGPNPGTLWVHDGKKTVFNTSAYDKNFELKEADPAGLSEYDGKSNVTNCAPDGTSTIRVAKSGVGSEAPMTIIQAFADAVAAHPNAAALKYEADGEWNTITWTQYHDLIHQTARAMLTLGIKPHDSVNIIGFNSVPWALANFGAIFSGGMAAGIYTTNGTDACKYIVEHSKARIVVVENDKQLQKFLPFRDDMPNLAALVQWDGKLAEGVNSGDSKVPVYTWEDFLKLGAKPAEGAHPQEKELEDRKAAQKPGDSSLLIYTSGTTGNPKAVMLSHDNFTWTCKSVFTLALPPQVQDEWKGKEIPIVSYLPLSHIAAQTLDFAGPLLITALKQYPMSAFTAFARPDALKGSLKGTLQAIRPGMFFGVPRVWEKFQEALLKIGKQNKGIKKMISDWAKGKGTAKFNDNQVGGNYSVPGMMGLAGAIHNKVKSALGLDRAFILLTGAAPIRKETIQYFGQFDMPVCELYGMSECTGPQTVSDVLYRKVGSCGFSLPGTELKIDHVSSRDEPGNGEICYRGRHIMMGYMHNPEKTSQTVDKDGWLHSGDVGRVDKHGLLYITGRIKELIIGAGGENIAPVPIENELCKQCPAISGAMLVGDKRKYNVCLITLHCEDDGEGGFTEKLSGAALEAGFGTTLAEARESKEFNAMIEEARVNTNKLAVSNASKVQKFYIVPCFSVPEGDLTPTLKLKRSVVNKKYADLIDWLYTDNKTPYVWK